MVLMDGKDAPSLSPGLALLLSWNLLSSFLGNPLLQPLHSLLGSLKLVTPEGAPVRGLRAPEIPMTEAVEAVGTWNWAARGPEWRLKGSPRVTGTAFLPAMVGGRLQAFWKHGVQVWALGSDQVSVPSPSPTALPPLSPTSLRTWAGRSESAVKP